jgi:hypothetical protein
MAQIYPCLHILFKSLFPLLDKVFRLQHSLTISLCLSSVSSGSEPADRTWPPPVGSPSNKVMRNSSTELLHRHELAASTKPRGSMRSPQIVSVQPPLSRRCTGSWPHTAILQPPRSVRRTRSAPENPDFAASAEFAPRARPQQCTCYMKWSLIG